MTKHYLKQIVRKGISLIVVICFSASLCVPPANAQLLPAIGVMVPLTKPYSPAIMLGVTVNPQNPLEFDFIINRGDENLDADSLKEESEKLIKYFLASLTVPEKEMWVNLSPYEKDRIIPQSFGLTEMGRDLLAQDYLLKQLTSSLMYPEDELGAKFWERVYAKANKQFGTNEVPVDTFHKIWIIPQKAVVYEHESRAFVLSKHLKVMLEEDYLAMSKNQEATAEVSDAGASSQIIREILIPEIEKEVNEGKNFANLRQIFNSMILASWYKKRLRESLLGQIYVDKNKVQGVNTDDPEIKQKIYEQYVAAFKKGIFDFVKEEYDPINQQVIPRKYFSGGVTAGAMDDAMVIVDRDSIPNEQGASRDFGLLAEKLIDRGSFNVKAKLDEPGKVNNAMMSASTGKLSFRRVLSWAALAIMLTGLPVFGGQTEARAQTTYSLSIEKNAQFLQKVTLDPKSKTPWENVLMVKVAEINNLEVSENWGVLRAAVGQIVLANGLDWPKLAAMRNAGQSPTINIFVITGLPGKTVAQAPVSSEPTQLQTSSAPTKAAPAVAEVQASSPANNIQPTISNQSGFLTGSQINDMGFPGFTYSLMRDRMQNGAQGYRGMPWGTFEASLAKAFKDTPVFQRVFGSVANLERHAIFVWVTESSAGERMINKNSRGTTDYGPFQQNSASGGTMDHLHYDIALPSFFEHLEKVAKVADARTDQVLDQVKRSYPTVYEDVLRYRHIVPQILLDGYYNAGEGRSISDAAGWLVGIVRPDVKTPNYKGYTPRGMRLFAIHLSRSDFFSEILEFKKLLKLKAESEPGEDLNTRVAWQAFYLATAWRTPPGGSVLYSPSSKNGKLQQWLVSGALPKSVTNPVSFRRIFITKDGQVNLLGQRILIEFSLYDEKALERIFENVGKYVLDGVEPSQTYSLARKFILKSNQDPQFPGGLRAFAAKQLADQAMLEGMPMLKAREPKTFNYEGPINLMLSPFHPAQVKLQIVRGDQLPWELQYEDVNPNAFYIVNLFDLVLKQYEVLGEERKVFGRAHESNLGLSDNQGISREHFSVEIIGNRVIVTDLGSKNGTLVECELKDQNFRDEIVQDNARKIFKEADLQIAGLAESLGGNARSNHGALSGYVDREGRIVEWGNIDDVRRRIPNLDEQVKSGALMLFIIRMRVNETPVAGHYKFILREIESGKDVFAKFSQSVELANILYDQNKAKPGNTSREDGLNQAMLTQDSYVGITSSETDVITQQNIDYWKSVAPAQQEQIHLEALGIHLRGKFITDTAVPKTKAYYFIDEEGVINIVTSEDVHTSPLAQEAAYYLQQKVRWESDLMQSFVDQDLSVDEKDTVQSAAHVLAMMDEVIHFGRRGKEITDLHRTQLEQMSDEQLEKFIAAPDDFLMDKMVLQYHGEKGREQIKHYREMLNSRAVYQKQRLEYRRQFDASIERRMAEYRAQLAERREERRRQQAELAAALSASELRQYVPPESRTSQTNEQIDASLERIDRNFKIFFGVIVTVVSVAVLLGIWNRVGSDSQAPPTANQAIVENESSVPYTYEYTPPTQGSRSVFRPTNVSDSWTSLRVENDNIGMRPRASGKILRRILELTRTGNAAGTNPLVGEIIEGENYLQPNDLLINQFNTPFVDPNNNHLIRQPVQLNTSAPVTEAGKIVMKLNATSLRKGDRIAPLLPVSALLNNRVIRNVRGVEGLTLAEDGFHFVATWDIEGGGFVYYDLVQITDGSSNFGVIPLAKELNDNQAKRLDETELNVLKTHPGLKKIKDRLDQVPDGDVKQVVEVLEEIISEYMIYNMFMETVIYSNGTYLGLWADKILSEGKMRTECDLSAEMVALLLRYKGISSLVIDGNIYEGTSKVSTFPGHAALLITTGKPQLFDATRFMAPDYLAEQIQNPDHQAKLAELTQLIADKKYDELVKIVENSEYKDLKVKAFGALVNAQADEQLFQLANNPRNKDQSVWGLSEENAKSLGLTSVWGNIATLSMEAMSPTMGNAERLLNLSRNEDLSLTLRYRALHKLYYQVIGKTENEKEFQQESWDGLRNNFTRHLEEIISTPLNAANDLNGQFRYKLWAVSIYQSFKGVPTELKEVFKASLDEVNMNQGDYFTGKEGDYFTNKSIDLFLDLDEIEFLQNDIYDALFRGLNERAFNFGKKRDGQRGHSNYYWDLSTIDRMMFHVELGRKYPRVHDRNSTVFSQKMLHDLIPAFEHLMQNVDSLDEGKYKNSNLPWLGLRALVQLSQSGDKDAQEAINRTRKYYEEKRDAEEKEKEPIVSTENTKNLEFDKSNVMQHFIDKELVTFIIVPNATAVLQKMDEIINEKPEPVKTAAELLEETSQKNDAMLTGLSGIDNAMLKANEPRVIEYKAPINLMLVPFKYGQVKLQIVRGDQLPSDVPLDAIDKNAYYIFVLSHLDRDRDKDQRLRFYEKLKEGVTVFGRNYDDNLGFTKSVHISREHFSVKRQGDTITITDLGSRNGTLIESDLTGHDFQDAIVSEVANQITLVSENNSGESIGGNAGLHHRAMNGYMDSEGRIVEWGNSQNVRERIPDLDKRVREGQWAHFTINTRFFPNPMREHYQFLLESVEVRAGYFSRALERLSQAVELANRRYPKPSSTGASTLNPAMLGEEDNATLSEVDSVGGIDMNSNNMDLQIKTDGNGVPLPMQFQNIQQINIEGFTPVIINITPITNPLPLLGMETQKDLEQLSFARP